MAARQPDVDPALVEEDQAGGVDLSQIGAPCRPLGDELGPVLLRRAEGFLRTKPSLRSARQIVGALARTPVRSAKRSAYSTSVKAFASATRSRSTARVAPPRHGAGPPRGGLASRRPSPRACCCQRNNVVSPTPNRLAIRARLSRPCSHARNTRCLRSAE